MTLPLPAIRNAVALACGALVLFGAGPVRAADVKLIETVWTTDTPDCPIRQIHFYDFGRAVVAADHLGTDGATWNLDPPVLHIYFDDWNGNLDGQILGGNDFEATYSWRSDETLALSSTQCVYKPK